MSKFQCPKCVHTSQDHPRLRLLARALVKECVTVAVMALLLDVGIALGIGYPAFAASCADTSTRCVGAAQEYTTIQAAANAAQAGDAVVVFAGSYAGFSTARSGSADNFITFTHNGSDTVTVTGQVSVNNNYIALNGLTFTHSDSYEGGAALRVGYSSRVNNIKVMNSTIRVGGSNAFGALLNADDLLFDGNLIEGNPTMFISVVSKGSRHTYSNNIIRNITDIERVFNVSVSDFGLERQRNLQSYLEW